MDPGQGQFPCYLERSQDKVGAGGDGAEGGISVSYCGSKAGSHTWPQLQQCSGSPGRWVLQHSVSEALPGGIGPSSSPASGSGAKESPWSHTCRFRASHHLPLTVRCSCSVLPWPGSCHSLCVTGRSSSTSPASSLPATGETTSYPSQEASETMF